MVAPTSTRFIRVDLQSDQSPDDRSPPWITHLLSFVAPESGDERSEAHPAASVLGCLQCASAGVISVDISGWASVASSPREPMSKLGSLIGTGKHIGQSTVELTAAEELRKVP